jgi:fibronectin-binding autotransporter adhesin
MHRNPVFSAVANPIEKRRSRFDRLTSRFILVSTIAALSFPALGVTLNWDAGITGGPGGGTGTWDTTSMAWFDGTNNVLWSNATPDDAVFGGTAGTVSLGTAITTQTVLLNSQNYVIDLNGFNLTINGTTGVGAGVALSSTTITNANSNIATLTTGGFTPITGPRITGNLNVVFTGSSGWNPSTDQTFTGTLSLMGAGTIRSDGIALGSPTGLVQLGGTHALQLGTAGGQFRTFTRDIELLNTTASITTGGLRTLTLAGTISGTGDFRQGATQGAVVLAGNNTYSGGTYLVGAGLSLIAASNTAFGNSTTVVTQNGPAGSVTASTIGFQGNVTIGNSATIGLPGGTVNSGLGSLQNFSGDNTFGGNITLGSNTPRVFGVNADSSLKLTGELSQARGFTKVGAGTLILTGKNIYGTSGSAGQGWTAVNSGILRLDFSQTVAGHDVDILNFGISSNTAATYLSLGGGTLEIKGRPGATNSQRFKNNASAGLGFTINPGASNVVAVQNGAASLSANLGQINTRNVGGTVNFVLPTAGVFTLPIGTLPTGAAGEIVTANGAAFMIVSGNDWAARDGSSSIVGGSTLAGFYTPNDATSLSGNADMSNGTDTVLTSSPILSSLRFNNAAARTINATGQTLATGGILVTPAVGNNLSTITGGTLQGNTGAANQDLVIIQNNPAGELAIGSAITDNAIATGLTKSGAGTLTLTGANTYSGVTTVNEGLLKLSSATALPGGIDTTMGAAESGLTFNGGVIGLTAASGNFTRSLGTGAGAVRFLGSGGFAAYGGDRTVDIGGAGASVSWHNSGSNPSNFVPTMSDLILSAPDADGTLIFQNGINTLSSPASPISRTIRVANGSAAVDARLAGVVSAEGGLIKTGPGTLEMSAVNTYTGPTVIDEGDLIVSGSLNAGSPVAVNSDGTLIVSGTGKVSGPLTVNAGGKVSGSSTPLAGTSVGAITVNAGGKIAPGAGVGVLSSGSVAFNGGELALEITDGLSFDKLNVTGTVSLNAPVNLTIALATALANDTLITIIDNDGSEAVNQADSNSRFFFNGVPLEEGSIFNVTGGFGVQQFQVSYGGGTGNDVVLVAVPEPKAAVLLFGSLAAWLGLRRPRRSSLNLF